LPKDSGFTQTGLTFFPSWGRALCILDDILSSRIDYEIAGIPNLALLLLGMGLDEFSMSPASILPIRKLFRSCNYGELKDWVKETLDLECATQVK